MKLFYKAISTLALLFLFTASVYAGTLVPFPKFSALDSDGNPLSGGLLYTYEDGTTTPQSTCTDNACLTPNSNPVVLDANGQADVWLTPGVGYKFILKDVDDITQWTVDDISSDALIGPIGSSVVVDLATLRSAAVTNSEAILLQYHTTANDGGGGQFRGVTGGAPGTYVDNNGTIIVPTAGDGSAAWLRDSIGYINARWFGATGDGATDDTAAIQAAINAKSAEGGGKVVIPEGVYKTTSAITMLRNVSLRGTVSEQSTPVTRIVAYHTGNIIEATELIQWIGGIYDLALEKELATYGYTGAAVRITGNATGTTVVGHGELKNLFIIYPNIGIHCSNWIYGQMSDIRIKDPAIGIHFDGSGTAVPSNNFIYAHNIVINATSGVGIGLKFTGVSSDNKLSQISIEDSVQAISFASSGSGTYIDGLWLEGNTENILHSGTSDLHVSKVTNATALDLIDSGSTAADRLHISTYYSSTGSAQYSIGAGVGNVGPGSVNGAISSPYDPLLHESGLGTKHEDVTMTQNNSVLGSFGSMGTLGGLYGGYGAPKKNEVNLILNSWGGAGTITTGISDPWGGTTAETLSGQVSLGINLGVAIASKRIVITGFIYGDGSELAVRVDGSATINNDYYKLLGSRWHQFISIRDVPASQTGNIFTIYLTAATGDVILSRVSAYIGDDMAVPSPALSDFTEMISVQSEGKNFSCSGAAAPTIGTWQDGDRVYNTAPAAAGTIGWVCTTAGAPGTWKAFGTIAP